MRRLVSLLGKEGSRPGVRRPVPRREEPTGGVMKTLRYAVRSLRKSPGFTAVAVVALALGIGANTAIFSLVQAVFLQPLPYEHPDRLVQITSSAPDQGIDQGGVSWPRLEVLR